MALADRMVRRHSNPTAYLFIDTKKQVAYMLSHSVRNNVIVHSTAGLNRDGSQPSWLASFPDLARITDDAWLDALQMTTELTVPAGTLLIRKGDPCRSFVFVSEGTVRVYERSDMGREIVLYRVKSGEICILTMSNLVDRTDYVAEAITEERVKIATIPAIYFQNALARSEGFRNFIMATLARRLSAMMRLVEQIAFQRLDLRLACLLGQLFGSQHTTRVTVTHQDLANELGTAREVISRLLKEFEHMRCIRLHRGEIELVSQEALARLSDHMMN